MDDRSITVILGVLLSTLVIILAAGPLTSAMDLSHSTPRSISVSFSAAPQSNRPVEFADNFLVESSLNASDWVPNGVAATAAMSTWGPCRVNAATPTIQFSPSQGLILGGASADCSFAAVQSVPGFYPPFTAHTRVMATLSNGNPIAFAITAASGSPGISLVGNINVTNPYYSMGAQAGAEIGSPWIGVQVLNPHPVLGVWYDVSIGVDASGLANVSLSSGSTLIGAVSYFTGNSEYFLLLGQFVDRPPMLGQNSASWSSVSVNGTGGLGPPAGAAAGAPAAGGFSLTDSLWIGVALGLGAAGVALGLAALLITLRRPPPTQPPTYLIPK